MDIQNLIKDNKIIITGIFLIFLMTASNKSNYERFIAVILDCVTAAGEMVLDFSETLLGVLSAVTDFFEALQYILFGNFSLSIRFVMANYTILFASIVSFYTTLKGLGVILDWRLAIVLSFAIQMVLVLVSLYWVQMLRGEPVKWKKVVEYYLRTYYPILDVPCVSTDVSEDKGKKNICKIIRFLRSLGVKIIFGVITAILVFMSSVLTYVYLYDTKLDDYVVYKTAYDIMEEVKRDTAENIEKLDNYFECGKVILHSFWEKAGNSNKGGNSLNEFIDYLDGKPLEETEDEIKKAEEIFQNFEENIRGIAAEFQNKEDSPFGPDISGEPTADWDENDIQSTECNNSNDIISLARNMLDLKLYSSKELNSVENLLSQLREYLVTTDSESELELDSELELEHNKADKQAVLEKVQEIILYENELYAGVPILRDIKVKVFSNDVYDLQKWMKPVERGFSSKYEHYLEIADARLLVAGRAFGALRSMNNTFLWCMFGLSFIADVLIVFCCFIRVEQEAGKNNRIKRNLINSIFIKSVSENTIYDSIANIVMVILSGVGIIGLGYVLLSDIQQMKEFVISAAICICGIVFKITFPDLMSHIKKLDNNEDERIIKKVLTEQGLEILKHMEPKKVLKQTYIVWTQAKKWGNVPGGSRPMFMEKQIETARSQEFFEDCCSISQNKLEEEIMLLCSEELACPVMDEAAQIKGYVITKECMHLLMKEMFDAAKKRGLDIRMLKEDLKEYEEDFWN